jgi:hypothetical protein
MLLHLSPSRFLWLLLVRHLLTRAKLNRLGLVPLP